MTSYRPLDDGSYDLIGVLYCVNAAVSVAVSDARERLVSVSRDHSFPKLLVLDDSERALGRIFLLE